MLGLGWTLLALTKRKPQIHDGDFFYAIFNIFPFALVYICAREMFKNNLCTCLSHRQCCWAKARYIITCFLSLSLIAWQLHGFRIWLQTVVWLGSLASIRHVLDTNVAHWASVMSAGLSVELSLTWTSTMEICFRHQIQTGIACGRKKNTKKGCLNPILTSDIGQKSNIGKTLDCI